MVKGKERKRRTMKEIKMVNVREMERESGQYVLKRKREVRAKKRGFVN